MAEPQQEEDLQNEAVLVQPLELDDEASSHANAKRPSKASYRKKVGLMAASSEEVKTIA